MQHSFGKYLYFCRIKELITCICAVHNTCNNKQEKHLRGALPLGCFAFSGLQ